MLLDGDRGAGGGAGSGCGAGASRRHARRMNLGQVVSRRLRLQWQLQVKLLPHRGVHDAAREDVREAAVVTRAPGEHTDRRV